MSLPMMYAIDNVNNSSSLNPNCKPFSPRIAEQLFAHGFFDTRKTFSVNGHVQISGDYQFSEGRGDSKGLRPITRFSVNPTPSRELDLGTRTVNRAKHMDPLKVRPAYFTMTSQLAIDPKPDPWDISMSSSDDSMELETNLNVGSNANCRRMEVGMLEHPEDAGDDLGLRSLARAIELSQAQPRTAGLLNPSFYLPRDESTEEAVRGFRPTFQCPEPTRDIYRHRMPVKEAKFPLQPLGKNIQLPRTEWLSTERLFFLFYNCSGDILQFKAGSELFDRGWRFNKVTQFWIGRFQGCSPEDRTDTYERGYYQHFNAQNWTREKVYLTLYYKDLADKYFFIPRNHPNF